MEGVKRFGFAAVLMGKSRAWLKVNGRDQVSSEHTAEREETDVV